MSLKTSSRFEPQKLNYSGDAVLVHTVDFPIYYIECIGERHFVIAGGGGSSKTGVHNQINILELVPTSHSCTADLVMKFNTPEEIPDAIMNASIIKGLPVVDTRLVTAGSQATVYKFTFVPASKNFEFTDYQILRDKKTRAEFKCVKSIPGKIYLGACDGKFLSWDISEDKNQYVERVLDIHRKEIDEIDYDPISQQISTTSRDEGRCAIWNANTMKLVHELKRESINSDQTNVNVKYNFRSSRFAYNLMSKSDKNQLPSYLLVTCNPIPAKGSSQLYKWNTSNYKQFTSIPVTNDGVMAMTTSLDGQLVAIGTRSGSVSIFDVASLKSLYKFDGAHHNAVTNLAFLEPRPESYSLANSSICPLLSVSIDRRVVLHRPKKGSTLSGVCYILITVLLIYFVSSIVHKSFI